MRSIALVLIVLTAACAAPELTDERRAVISSTWTVVASTPTGRP